MIAFKGLMAARLSKHSILIAVGLAALLANVAMAAASDTPALGNGDCWQSGTPLTCRTNFAGRSTTVHFRAIDQFSSTRPAWLSPAQSAVSAWSSAGGPRVYSWSSYSGDTWIYLNYSSTGEHDLTSGDLAVTWNCNASSYCTDVNSAMNIYWTDIYLNHNEMDGETSSHLQNTFAHESGRGMGLWHNSSSSSLMYPYLANIGGPQSMDIGSYPGCASGGLGVDCIYGWGD